VLGWLARARYRSRIKLTLMWRGCEAGDDVGCGVSPAFRKKKSMSDIEIYRQLFEK
jgi:hypothetical protein